MDLRPHDQGGPRRLAIGVGLTDLTLLFIICGVYSTAIMVAERLPILLALFTLVSEMQTVYLAIYALGYFELIDGERCDRLIESAVNLSLVDNFFEHPAPRVRPWPMPVLACIAKYAARLATLAEGDVAS